ncbi:MAG TPA: DUF5011 domain-containing protein, partial [Bacteroidia bacterium]|nr:DUF5011 domain-containing protein [Bacteroidia bacterium]
ISSCSKDDTPPVITLLGDNPMTVSLNGAYIELGAAATDDEDGDVTANISISGSVDVDAAGTYTITYSVSDKEGNAATETRTVNVENDAAYLNGTYNMTEAGNSPWTQSVTASSTINNRVIFGKFANFSNNDKIYGTVVGSTIEIGTQTGNDIGSGGCDHVFSQDGSNTIPIAQVSGKWNFSIKFTDTRLAGGSGCTATAPVPYEDYFNQQ